VLLIRYRTLLYVHIPVVGIRELSSNLPMHRAKFGWHPVSDVAAVTKLVEFCWEAQTGKSVSAVSGPKFAILWVHVEDLYCCLTGFFSDCRYMP